MFFFTSSSVLLESYMLACSDFTILFSIWRTFLILKAYIKEQEFILATYADSFILYLFICCYFCVSALSIILYDGFLVLKVCMSRISFRQFTYNIVSVWYRVLSSCKKTPAIRTPRVLVLMVRGTVFKSSKYVRNSSKHNQHNDSYRKFCVQFFRFQRIAVTSFFASSLAFVLIMTHPRFISSHNVLKKDILFCFIPSQKIFTFFNTSLF